MAGRGSGKRGGRKGANRPPGMMARPAPARKRGPALTKAELRAQGDRAVAAATSPIVKLPTKLARQCGRCGEFTTMMVAPGQDQPAFKCKSCDAPTKRG